MIIFFGPAGAGKSMQGQILAARHGWRWLSAGQLLRDTRDPEIFAIMKAGDLVPVHLANKIVFEAMDTAHACADIGHVILDGYPRTIEQARGMTEHETTRCGDDPEFAKKPGGVSLIIVLEVGKTEILHRLAIRGRMEDDPATIEHRLQIYRSEIYPLLDYYNDLNVPIEHVDGVGTVGEVHDRIEAALVSYNLVPALPGDVS